MGGVPLGPAEPINGEPITGGSPRNCIRHRVGAELSRELLRTRRSDHVVIPTHAAEESFRISALSVSKKLG